MNKSNRKFIKQRIMTRPYGVKTCANCLHGQSYLCQMHQWQICSNPQSYGLDAGDKWASIEVELIDMPESKPKIKQVSSTYKVSVSQTTLLQLIGKDIIESIPGVQVVAYCGDSTSLYVTVDDAIIMADVIIMIGSM